MPRREEGENIPHHHHLLVAREIVQTPQGTGIIVEGYSDGGPEARECLREGMEARGMMQIKDGKIPGTDIRVGLGGIRWNSAWQPEGPKPNYGKPPADPRVN